jgi:hypothetical protein
VLEAVCGGVPMIGWPLHAEQRMTRVVLVKELKVALTMNKSEYGLVSAAELEKRVRELMDSVAGKVVRERVSCMRDDAVRNGFGPNSTQKLTQELRFPLTLINISSP